MANKNPPAKPFAKGNQLYQLASHTGRPKIFETPEDLWLAATKYFEYCVDNPLLYFSVRYGKFAKRYRMQPMSWRALCFFTGINSFKNYKKLPGFSEVIDRISDVFHVHNFSGAATNQLKYKFVNRNPFL